MVMSNVPIDELIEEFVKKKELPHETREILADFLEEVDENSKVMEVLNYRHRAMTQIPDIFPGL